MKTTIIIACIAFATSAQAQDTTTAVSGPHGGLLKTVENYKIETLNSYGCITAYLFDRNLTSIPNKSVSGDAMFFYNNGVSLNKFLIPSGTDAFTTDVLNLDYYYYTVQFKVNEKMISAKFDNFLGIAIKENSKKTIYK